MREILKRLFANPVTGIELLVASLFANALALATPIFVILVLNRYVAFGVDTTLATIAAGAIIAVSFEFAFRRVRMRIAERAVHDIDTEVSEQGIRTLSRTKYAMFQLLSPHARNQAATGGDTIRAAYGAQNLTTLLDVPFALLFLGALALLDVRLALVATLFAALALIFGLSTLVTLNAPVRRQMEAGGLRAMLVNAAFRAGDTVRMFDNAGLMDKMWRSTGQQQQDAHETAQRRQDVVQTATMSLQALMSVAMVSTGAMLVVAGDLNVGVLMGANILGARVLGPLIKLGGMARTLVQARQTQATLRELRNVPTEKEQGAGIEKYKGGLSFDDVAFSYPGSRTMLLESLSLKIEPGQTLAVTGTNGAGKSTLAQLIAGLREPTRGRVMADGIDLQQLDPRWWRRQVCYLPQEPKFLPGTIRENLLAANPKLTEPVLNGIIELAGLRTFIDESADGLDMKIADGGSELALGIRRRLALARAVAVGGKLLLVDEPTEGLDEAGRKQVYALMNRHAERGGTVVACSHDPHILKGADWVIDLDRKPQPRVSSVPRSANGKDLEAGE